MSEAILGVTFLLGLGAIGISLRGQRIRQLTLDRLGESAVEEEEPERVVRARPALRSYWYIPWAVALLLVLCLWGVVQIGLLFAATIGLIVAVLGTLLEGFLKTRRMLVLEMQLSDAIDILVGSLRAGTGVADALDSAAREARKPLRPHLEELLNRIRLGDDPQEALEDLVERVPLEPYRLFASTLSVHWEVGGSLAPTLSTVGKTIRDRAELSRRIRGQTTEARASVIGILGIVYFLALLMWRSDPARMEQFLATSLGEAFVIGAMLLQAVGLIWITRLSQIKF